MYDASQPPAKDRNLNSGEIPLLNHSFLSHQAQHTVHTWQPRYVMLLTQHDQPPDQIDQENSIRSIKPHEEDVTYNHSREGHHRHFTSEHPSCSGLTHFRRANPVGQLK